MGLEGTGRASPFRLRRAGEEGTRFCAGPADDECRRSTPIASIALGDVRNRPRRQPPHLFPKGRAARPPSYHLVPEASTPASEHSSHTARNQADLPDPQPTDSIEVGPIAGKGLSLCSPAVAAIKASGRRNVSVLLAPFRENPPHAPRSNSTWRMESCSRTVDRGSAPVACLEPSN
jgi:hypothetical protein